LHHAREIIGFEWGIHRTEVEDVGHECVGCRTAESGDWCIVLLVAQVWELTREAFFLNGDDPELPLITRSVH
jgi:hypothetical protein